MDFTSLAQIIGTLGFPIVACCGMAYFFAKVNDNYRNDIKEIQANHKEEIAGIQHRQCARHRWSCRP